MPISDALEAFLHRLTALCEPIDDVTLAQRRADAQIEIELRPSAALGLRVGVTATDTQICVALGPWRETWSLSTDADEALDLVAAALFGRVRLVVHAARGRPFRWDVEALVDDRWVHHATIRRLRLWPWPKATVQVERNEIAPPSTVRLGPMGRLPYAPWAGLLDTPEDGPSVGTLPVDGELDLHPFSPKEVAGVVRAYIDACLEQGITELRIVHGKGIGNLRRTVHALLDRHPNVAGHRLGGHGGGSWGATIVDLVARDPTDAEDGMGNDDG